MNYKKPFTARSLSWFQILTNVNQLSFFSVTYHMYINIYTYLFIFIICENIFSFYSAFLVTFDVEI